VNRSSYEAIAKEWDTTRVRLAEAEQRLLDLTLAVTQSGDRVLDLGCGTGRPIAQYVVARGCSVTGVDQAPSLLAIARARMPSEEWIESRLEDFDPGSPYGAAILWDCLFHVPRDDHATILRKVRGALPRGRRLALTVGGSEHPPFTDTMFGQTFFYDSHSPEKTVRVLEQVGFRVIQAEFLNLPTSGRDKGRYAIVASAA